MESPQTLPAYTNVPYETSPAEELLAFLSTKHVLPLIKVIDTKAQTFGELEQALGVNTTSLTKRVRELETAKIISRVTCPKHRRLQYYQLSIYGQEILQAVKSLAQTAQKFHEKQRQ